MQNGTAVVLTDISRDTSALIISGEGSIIESATSRLDENNSIYTQKQLAVTRAVSKKIIDFCFKTIRNWSFGGVK